MAFRYFSVGNERKNKRNDERIQTMNAFNDYDDYIVQYFICVRQFYCRYYEIQVAFQIDAILWNAFDHIRFFCKMTQFFYSLDLDTKEHLRRKKYFHE